MKRLAGCVLAALSFAPLPAVQEKLPADVAKLFDYEAKASLDIQETTTYRREGCKVIDLTYVSPRGGHVPAWLVVPNGKGPFAGIVFGHWGGGDRSEFLSEAELYARAGAVSVLIAYPWTRPAPWYHGVPETTTPEKDREVYTQAVVDLRRGFDLLLARSDVDSKRIAYVGHSYGAQWGAILTAIDRRMKTTILVGGTPTLAEVFLHDDPATEEVRKSVGMEAVNRYLEINRPLDAINFIGRSTPIPLFFQFATFEQNFKKDAMDCYFAAAGEPKTVRWYDTAHDLNDIRVIFDRSEWLEAQIGIGSIAPFVEEERRGKS